MTSKLKALGLALLAIAAMSMIAASAAQAGLGELHVTWPEKAVLTAERVVGTEHVLKLAGLGGEIRCTGAISEGTLKAPGAPQLTANEGQVTATYPGCQAFTKPGASVDMNGCKYTLTGGVNEQTAEVDITGCTEAKKHILITTPIGCTVTIPEQHNLSHITFTNEGSGQTEDVLDHITIQGIKYIYTGVFCPEKTEVLHQDGTYSGTTTIKAFKDLGSVQKEHNGHKYNQLLCGEQVGLFAT